MFICEKCLSGYESIGVPMWMMPTSFGPCELCGEVHKCIDHHGSLIPKKETNPAIRDMLPFEDEKLNKLFTEQSEELKRQLSPIIDQIAMLNLRRLMLPTDQTYNVERKKEHNEFMKYYTGLICSIVGYTPQE